MQVRFQRNIAASSLAAGCDVPQRPPAIIRSFTSIQMARAHTHPHTCSEISYRITDVECIGRAQTIP